MSRENESSTIYEAIRRGGCQQVRHCMHSPSPQPSLVEGEGVMSRENESNTIYETINCCAAPAPAVRARGL